MVEVEQSAKPLGFANSPILANYSLVGEGDDIIEPLMITFVLMVGKIFIERVTQRTLVEENELIETFILDLTHPAFGEGVEVGGLWWKFDGLNAGGAENVRCHKPAAFSKAWSEINSANALKQSLSSAARCRICFGRNHLPARRHRGQGDCRTAEHSTPHRHHSGR
jgi:hypothetical protein